MIIYLLKLWSTIVNLGVHEGLKESEKIKVKLINKLFVVGVVVAIGLIFVRCYFDIGSPWSAAMTIVLIMMCLLFNYKRWYNVTRHIICILYPTYFMYVFYSGDGNLAEINVLLLIGLMVLILYEDKPKLKIISLAYVFLIGAVIYYILLFDPIQLEISNNYSNYISSFISTLFVFGSIVYFVQKDIMEYDHSNNLLLDELTRKHEELERFAYVTSHDLKEPVRNIGGLAEVLQSRIRNPEAVERNKEIIDLIKVSSSRMSSLIDSILNFSKIDAEEFYSEEVAINDLVTEFISSHEQFISNRNASINFEKLPVINGNKIFLSLLFQNLLENSIIYNDSEPPVISIKGFLKDNTVIVVISDNGIGINEEFYDYIFEPFKKLNTDILFKGSGLGLSICKKVVEYHGGLISVFSKKGEGSKFTLSFPRNN